MIASTGVVAYRPGQTNEEEWMRMSCAAWKILVSQCFGLLLISVVALPCSAAVSQKQAKLWRAEIRKALFISDPLPQLAPESHGSFVPTPGVVAERVTYGTEFGMRVPAIVYRQADDHKRMPAIVVVNGHGGDKASWYAYYTGVLYARAGAVVLTYDPIGENERNDDHKSATGEHDKRIDVPGVPARMGGLMVTDVMQAVSYLRQRPDVDPHRIAVLGFSMGSFVSALAGAVDTRVHAVLLTGGGDLDGTNGYWDRSAPMCQGGPYRALSFLEDRPAVLYALNAQRGKTFILNGTNDTVVDIPHHEADFFDALRQRVIALNGKKNVFETYFVPQASHRPAWIMKVAALWLEKNLHFPNWTAAKVEASPVISIRDWAAQVGLRLNKSAQREDRDAGISAIAANVPRLTQDELNVLPLDEWQRERKKFVYSTWAKDAIADANGSHLGQ